MDDFTKVVIMHSLNMTFRFLFILVATGLFCEGYWIPAIAVVLLELLGPHLEKVKK